MQKFQKEISILGLMGSLLSINRARFWVDNAEAKIDKLESIIQKFERKHGAVEGLDSWIGDIDAMRSRVETKHSELVSAVEKAKTYLDDFKRTTTNDFKSRSESEYQNFVDFLNKKSSDLADTIQGEIDEISNLVENKKAELNLINEQIKEDSRLSTDSRKNSVDMSEDISKIHAECEKLKAVVDQHAATTAKVLSDAQKALTSATSAELAKEFERQKEALKKSHRNWTVSLFLSLVAAAIIAYCRFDAMLDILSSKEHISDFRIFINCLISVAAIGAPVWFAWLSTKQIGYCFRLSEDYAFKAATAASFEGFRKEVEALSEADEESSKLRVKLLATMLTRLDEQPLRYVDNKTEGSPFHELLQKMPFGNGKSSSENER